MNSVDWIRQSAFVRRLAQRCFVFKDHARAQACLETLSVIFPQYIGWGLN